MEVIKVFKDVMELSPLAQLACGLFMQRCKADGIDIFITETYRTQDRQNYLYEQGRTRPGQIVTWTKNSRHTSRRAWDIACSGRDLYNREILNKCGNIAKELGITWGGIWDTPDIPHFEISETWKAPVGIKIEKQEVEKMAAPNEKRFNTIDELPDWAKDIIKKLISEGKITDAQKLDISMDMLRVLVILNR